MKRDTNEKIKEGKREREREREREIFLECQSASETILPSVRCCLAAPELIRTHFRDVRSHPVE